MARPPFVDAHLHLWDRKMLRYPWLEDPAMAAIAPSYDIEDYRREAAAWNVAACVHVEAGADADDSFKETEWLESIRAIDAWPSAIIAHVALHEPSAQKKLEWQAQRSAVRGIRHIVNWHPDPAKQAYAEDLTRNPAWQRGYALLGPLGLNFDFHGHPPQLAAMAEMARAHPEIPLILNHLALPGATEGLEEWRAGLIKMAALPHVAIKLSGAGFIAQPFEIDAFRSITREVIDLFGTARVMVATNFPTDRLFASMDETLLAYEDILSQFSEDERRDLWGRNANRIYRLGLQL